MAQAFNQSDQATFSQTLAFSSGAGETVALTDIPYLGFRNVAITIYCSSGTMTSFALYGSPDKIHWKSITVSSFSVTAGNMDHVEVSTNTNWRYLKLTTTGVSVLDVFLDGC